MTKFIALFKERWAKAKAWFLGSVLFKILKQLWSLVSDHDWDLDPWKIGGFVAYTFALLKANQLFDLVSAGKVDGMLAGTLGGLIAGFITVGTFLMNQAMAHDATLAKKE
jgi:hypothetical protein